MQEAVLIEDNENIASTNTKGNIDKPDHNENIFQLLFKEDDLTWQSIIHELVRTEQMDPWDVDISLLAKRYIEMLKQLKALDFRLSGKVILAAAMLLKIKSNKLVGSELTELTRLMNTTNDDEDDDYFEEEDYVSQNFLMDNSIGNIASEPKIVPRTPQPRDRKVSIYDLMDALEKALTVKRRRIIREKNVPKIKKPEAVDISKIIDELYDTIKDHFEKPKTKKLTFSQLIPSNSKEDKVYTFIPLLHLTNQRKIDIEQEEHFGDIEIMLASTREEVKKQLQKTKKLPKSKHFKTKDNQCIKSLEELAKYIENNNIKTFRNYVNKRKKQHTFYEWVRDSLKDYKLAEKMKDVYDYHETLCILNEALQN